VFASIRDEKKLDSISLPLPFGVKTELVEFLAHGEAGNSEPSRGFGLIAAGQLDGAAKYFFLGGLHQARVGVVQLSSLGGGEQTVHVFAQGLLGGGDRWGGAGQGFVYVVKTDGVALGQQQNFAHDVFQLAHVPRPVLRPEQIDGLGLNRRVIDPQFSRVFAKEVLHKVGNGLLAAEPLETFLLQDAQQLDLRAGSHIADFIVSSVATGVEAVDRFDAMRPALVLLDLKTPGQEGWDASERIRRLEPRVPVILTTVWPNQHERAIRRGISALMEKPLDLSLLLKTIRDLLPDAALTRAEIVG
jgi:CheY-like chemotaxis protein